MPSVLFCSVFFFLLILAHAVSTASGNAGTPTGPKSNPLRFPLRRRGDAVRRVAGGVHSCKDRDERVSWPWMAAQNCVRLDSERRNLSEARSQAVV